METLIDSRIARDIANVFGSSQQPSYGVIARRFKDHSYGPLIRTLSEHFAVVDLTEPNMDTSLGLELTSPAAKRVLRLSLVGRYAALFRMRDLGQPWTPVCRTDRALGIEDARILDALTRENVELLETQVLERPIRFSLGYTPPDRVTVFHVLFSDCDVLPWRSGAGT